MKKEEAGVLIIVPAFNEEASISKVIGEIRACGFEDIAVINDCSTDSTSLLARKAGAAVLDLPYNLGIGGTMQSGYRYALERGYRYAVQVDGDGQHDPGAIGELLRPLQKGSADLVIGSRFQNRGGYRSTLARRVGIRFLSGLIRVVTGLRLSDVTSGFRAAGEKAIRVFAAYYPPDYPEPESIVVLARRGGRIAERQVTMRERAGGASSITQARAVYYMIKVSLAILLDTLKR